jgi:hypothetical protein
MLVVGPWLWKKANIHKERQSMNYAEGTLTEIGLKWSNKKKRRSEVRENEMLNEKIKEDRSTRKMDRGKLNKWKKPPTDAMEHLVAIPKSVSQVDLGF